MIKEVYVEDQAIKQRYKILGEVAIRARNAPELGLRCRDGQ